MNAADEGSTHPRAEGYAAWDADNSTRGRLVSPHERIDQLEARIYQLETATVRNNIAAMNAEIAAALPSPEPAPWDGTWPELPTEPGVEYVGGVNNPNRIAVQVNFPPHPHTTADWHQDHESVREAWGAIRCDEAVWWCDWTTSGAESVCEDAWFEHYATTHANQPILPTT